MKHNLIPNVVYDNLRSIHESRAKRHDNEAVVPHLTNVRIFEMMPDRRDINWMKGEQQPLIDATLAAMWHTVTWSEAI